MEIYRISCIVLFIIIAISGLLLIIFPRMRHKESFFMQTLNNLNIGFFSGLMISFILSLLSYFYVKNVFISNLIHQSRYIYSNLEDMNKNLAKLDYKTNPQIFFNHLPVLLEHLENRTLTIENDAKKVNFIDFSPFFKETQISKEIEKISTLFYEFRQYPDFFIRMRFLQNEREQALEAYDREAQNTAEKDIEKFMGDLTTSVTNNMEVLNSFLMTLKEENISPIDSWETFEKIKITDHKPKSKEQKEYDKQIKK